MRIVTIGGYGFTESGFVNALEKAGVNAFVDVRQRRGMRGAKYAFLNSARLQDLLAAAKIKYIHAVDLAPTSEVREVQKNEDRARDIVKRERIQLSTTFIQKYRSEILTTFEPDALRRALNGADVVALFCVEGQPSACHRSLAAAHLAQVFGSQLPVEHLTP